MVDNNLVILSQVPKPILMEVRGKVTDFNGNPLPYVNVILKGTTVGTATDDNGMFSIDAKKGDVLVFSMIGYGLKEVIIGDGPMNVTLVVVASLLDEVQVIGYGTQKRTKVTGAISTLNSAALSPEKNISSNIGKTLQGKIPGLFIASTDGTPNSQPNIQIRGVQSAIASMANPLLVVDGLIVENNTLSLNNINSQDIESVEILKDAASAAIYGARGSTGVIIITTKKGKINSKPTINVNSYYGFNNVQTNRNLLSTDEYKMAFTESRQNRIGDIDKKLIESGLSPDEIFFLNVEKSTLNSEIKNLNLSDRSTNWLEKIKNKNAMQHNLMANMTGGNEKTQYYMSLGRYREDNTIGTGRFQRYSGRIDIYQKVTNWLKVGGNIAFTNNTSTDFTSPLVYALEARPDSPYELEYNPDGSYAYYVGQQYHPLGVMADHRNSIKQNNLTGVLTMEVTINKNLTFRSLFAGNKADGSSYNYNSPLSYIGRYIKGSAGVRNSEGFNYNSDNYFTYEGKLKKLTTTITLGQSFYSTEQRSYGYDLQNFPPSIAIYGTGAGWDYGTLNNKPYLNNFYYEYS